ncbi:MAG: hypothetical protein Kow0069_22240 [Promethearchaeota archaeon]
MSGEIESLINALLDEEPNVYGVALIDANNQLVYQTENWDLTSDVGSVLAARNGEGTAMTLQGVKYMIVENTPERTIGTNVTGQGHVIVVPAGNGLLVTYISPQAGPRDALFNVQSFGSKFAGKL